MTPSCVAGPVASSEHDGGRAHPERPDRLVGGHGRRTRPAASTTRSWTRRCARRPSTSCPGCTPPAYLAELEAFCARGGGAIDPDTFARPDSWRRRAGRPGRAWWPSRSSNVRARAWHSWPFGRPGTTPGGPGHGVLPGQQRGRGGRLTRRPRASGSWWSTGTSTTATGPRPSSGTIPTSCTSRPTSIRSIRERGDPTRSGGPGAPGLTVNLPLPAGATGDVVRCRARRGGAAADRGVPPGLGAGLVRVRRAPCRPSGRAGPLERRLRRAGPPGELVRSSSGPGRPVPRGWLRPRRPRLVGGGDAGRAGRRADRRGAADGGRARHRPGPRRRCCAGRPPSTGHSSRWGRDRRSGGGRDSTAPAGAAAAVAWAARMAASLGMPLRIVHAVGLLEHGGVAGASPVDGDEAVSVARQAGLDAGAVTWCVVDGDPAQPCCGPPREPETAAILVVGSRGAGGPRWDAAREHQPRAGRARAGPGGHRPAWNGFGLISAPRRPSRRHGVSSNG